MLAGFHHRVLGVAPVPVVVVRPDGTVRYANARARTGLGLRPGGSLLEGFGHGSSSRVAAWFEAVLTSGPDRSSFVEAPFRVGRGSTRQVQATATNLLGDRLVRGLVVSLVDVTEDRARATEVALRAVTDSLTGLLNRGALAARWPETGCVVMLDLDHFKAVNDSRGHPAGDEVLRETARRLLASVPEGTTVVRVGGDEFVLLLPTCHERRAVALVEDVIARLTEPVRLSEGEPVAVSASAGLTEVTGLTIESALRRVDIALYRAKGTGRGTLAVYRPGDRVETRLQLAEKVRLLEELVRTDALTGLPNVRALKEDLERLGAGELGSEQFSAAFVDIDHFGTFNKAHGDTAGDAALRAVSQALVGSSREDDLVFRKGGEELVVLLPRTPSGTAVAVAERLRRSVAGLAIPHGGSPGTPVVTVTVGLATSRPDESPDAVVERASRAAYEAKTTGRRNSVLAAPD